MTDNAVINFNEYSEVAEQDSGEPITLKYGSLTIEMFFMPPAGDADAGNPLLTLQGVIKISSSKDLGAVDVVREVSSPKAIDIRIETHTGGGA